jgi:hypothetical protein
MWTQRKASPRVIDLTAGPVPCPAPTTCASCEQPAPLLQMVGSLVAFCSDCFAEVYALAPR